MLCEDVNRYEKLGLVIFLGKKQTNKRNKQKMPLAFKENLHRIFDNFYDLITAFCENLARCLS